MQKTEKCFIGERNFDVSLTDDRSILSGIEFFGERNCFEVKFYLWDMELFE